MNRLAKGKRNERKSVDYLKENGFELVETVKSVKAFTNVDLFGLWDHIAVCTKANSFTVENINKRKETHPMSFAVGDILFIQTKTNQKPSQKKMQGHFDFRVNAHKLLVVWKDRIKYPRLISLNEDTV